MFYIFCKRSWSWQDFESLNPIKKFHLECEATTSRVYTSSNGWNKSYMTSCEWKKILFVACNGLPLVSCLELEWQSAKKSFNQCDKKDKD